MDSVIWDNNRIDIWSIIFFVVGAVSKVAIVIIIVVVVTKKWRKKIKQGNKSSDAIKELLNNKDSLDGNTLENNPLIHDNMKEKDEQEVQVSNTSWIDDNQYNNFLILIFFLFQLLFISLLF